MEIKFKPITEGLGFHPFSDGLPYAPVTKKAAVPPPPPPAHVMGTGAIAAGIPSFAAPRVYVPVARPTAMPAKSAVPAPEPAIEEQAPGFGYLFRRLCAFLLDTSFNVTLSLAGLSVVLWREDVSPELILNGNMWLVGAAFLALLSWALVLAQEIAFGTSIGKRVFGLAIHGSAAALFVRAFFFVPALSFGGIGILWAAIDGRKRCWHDRVSGVQPIFIPRQ